MGNRRSWAVALAGHRRAVQAFSDAVRRVPAGQWHSRASEAGWCPAEEALHVLMTYEHFGTAPADGPGMRPRVSPARALLLRWTLLPIMMRTGWFPAGVRSPKEFRPSPGEGQTVDAETLIVRLEKAAAASARALRAADPSIVHARLNHAYFGPLRPIEALRLLNVHTRHHARRLALQAD